MTDNQKEEVQKYLIRKRYEIMKTYLMEREPFDVEKAFEADYPLVQDKEFQKWIENRFIELGAIPKEKLVIGKTYIGNCRNASEAVWKGDNFVYDRHKFGTVFPEKINHFQDDDGYDVFVPIKEKEL